MPPRVRRYPCGKRRETTEPYRPYGPQNPSAGPVPSRSDGSRDKQAAVRRSRTRSRSRSPLPSRGNNQSEAGPAGSGARATRSRSRSVAPRRASTPRAGMGSRASSPAYGSRAATPNLPSTPSEARSGNPNLPNPAPGGRGGQTRAGPSRLSRVTSGRVTRARPSGRVRRSANARRKPARYND